LFTALGKAGKLEEVKELFKAARIKLDATSINSILKAYASGPRPLLSLEFFYDMTNSNYTDGKVEYFVPDKVSLLYRFDCQQAI